MRVVTIVPLSSAYHPMRDRDWLVDQDTLDIGSQVNHDLTIAG